MKTSALLLGLLSLAACQQSAEVAPHQDVVALQERFHGKYKPIRSISSLALDVNQDGAATTDMLKEITELSNTIIEVRIYGKNQYNAQPSFSFVHHWPKQELGLEEPASYDPTLTPFYSTKVVAWDFAFNGAVTELVLQPQSPDLKDPELYTPPQAVSVQDKDRIQVSLFKRLYTTQGWKTVQIVTLYERFTRTT
jgi:hypothetical protein